MDRISKTCVAFCSVTFVAMVAVMATVDLNPEGTRHKRFVEALWPKAGTPGRDLAFSQENAILYKDPKFPLTWHVCTANGCGRYYEDEGDAERSK